MKSLIVGYGSTGKSFERYLKINSIEFDVFDADSSKLVGKNHIENFNSEIGANYNKIYISPGINLKKYLSEKEINGLDFETDLDIFFKNNKSIKIGVTGTNGKSTLVNYLNQALNEVSTSIALGNIGNPMLDYIDHKEKYSVIEVSSFQLEKMQNNCFDFSVITNIQSDHIDFHGNFENYKNAKLKICPENMNTVFCQKDNYQKIVRDLVLRLEGKNLSNKFSFKNLPFRLEKLSNGIINDSKSTNTSSLLYAINKMDFKGNLIICGDPAKEGYKNLKIDGPKKVFIYGLHKEQLSKLISHPNVAVHENLDEIFEIITSENRATDILFSPGNPSGNDYSNFVERGEHFNQLKAIYFDQ